MTRDPKEGVRAQFEGRAPWYVHSRVHQRSEGLLLLLGLAGASPTESALDVATGTGFTAFALAPSCREVVAVDFTPAMLEEARRLRHARGITNVTFCLGDAEALPFRSGVFHVVTCRHAAHHFPALDKALAEMARVTRPGGRVILDDTCAPEDDDLATVMNAWERRRDPSHVVNRPPQQLVRLMERRGLHVDAVRMTAVKLEFDDWVQRSGLPPAQAAALRADFLSAPPRVRQAFRIRRRGDALHFAWDEIVVRGVKR